MFYTWPIKLFSSIAWCKVLIYCKWKSVIWDCKTWRKLNLYISLCISWSTALRFVYFYFQSRDVKQLKQEERRELENLAQQCTENLGHLRVVASIPHFLVDYMHACVLQLDIDTRHLQQMAKCVSVVCDFFDVLQHMMNWNLWCVTKFTKRNKL